MDLEGAQAAQREGAKQSTEEANNSKNKTNTQRKRTWANETPGKNQDEQPRRGGSPAALTAG